MSRYIAPLALSLLCGTVIVRIHLAHHVGLDDPVALQAKKFCQASRGCERVATTALALDEFSSPGRQVTLIANRAWTTNDQDQLHLQLVRAMGANAVALRVIASNSTASPRASAPTRAASGATK